MLSTNSTAAQTAAAAADWSAGAVEAVTAAAAEAVEAAAADCWISERGRGWSAVSPISDRSRGLEEKVFNCNESQVWYVK